MHCRSTSNALTGLVGRQQKRYQRTSEAVDANIQHVEIVQRPSGQPPEKLRKFLVLHWYCSMTKGQQMQDKKWQHNDDVTDGIYHPISSYRKIWKILQSLRLQRTLDKPMYCSTWWHTLLIALMINTAAVNSRLFIIQIVQICSQTDRRYSPSHAWPRSVWTTGMHL